MKRFVFRWTNRSLRLLGFKTQIRHPVSARVRDYAYAWLCIVVGAFLKLSLIPSLFGYYFGFLCWWALWLLDVVCGEHVAGLTQMRGEISGCFGVAFFGVAIFMQIWRDCGEPSDEQGGAR